MKVDLKREIPAYRARVGRFDVIELPPLQYLAIDGHGDPNTAAAYREAVTTIFPVAYTLKFASKQTLARDYGVMPLEALWWADDLSAFTTARDKSRWDWTLLNLVPDWIVEDHVADACAAAARRGAPATHRIRLERLDEGRCVQTLHLGPYDDEGPVLQELHEDVLPGQGLRPTGTHHEIYLNDPRRTDPARLRTILRQPVATIGA